MGGFHVFIVGSIVLLTFIVVAMMALNRKTFAPMQGMIISMFFGMNVGLTAGVLFGATFQGNLFLSTLFAMTTGVFAGSLCGLCFGILPIIEGLMAGLMGGMMGAMVGEMLRVEQSITFVQIFFFLSICTTFLIVMLSTPKKAKVHNKKWLLKPLALLIFAVVLMVGGNSIAEKQEIQKESDDMEKHHTGSSVLTVNV
ncbi:hypothetical protein [Sporosarcina koreensis]|uniref:Branched-chain amino acid ABC transporter permease n=1 Tax=Sporosarcina koreensis TaxID=334735 RepID=A0ABW0TVM2_9BACL